MPMRSIHIKVGKVAFITVSCSPNRSKSENSAWDEASYVHNYVCRDSSFVSVSVDTNAVIKC